MNAPGLLAPGLFFYRAQFTSCTSDYLARKLT